MNLPDQFAQRSGLFATRGAVLMAVLLSVLPVQSIHAAPVSSQRLATPQALPSVVYDESTNIITIGRPYDATKPAEAPFVGYPSNPAAPKDSITVPQLAAALAPTATAVLVNEGGGAWLLKADIVVAQNARLALDQEIAFNYLRINTTPSKLPRFNRIIADGGQIHIEGVKVTSWDTVALSPASEYGLGRAHLAALNGARMDIIDAEMAYLGYLTGEPSGLSWRKRATEGDAKTGATGSILNSKIHNNYFGMYSYEAIGIKIENSEIYANAVYGLDPHDASTQFEVRGNKVHNNGKHGIIFSRLCEQNLIENNEVYDNADHGIMMDRGSNNNNIVNNLVYGNVDGIAIFQSSFNLIQGNTLRNNTRGVRINATYDINDVFDGVSTSNFVISNTIENNTQYGVYLYERADRNTVRGNTIVGNASTGIYIKAGGNYIAGNTLNRNDSGIYVLGGPLSPITPTALISQPVQALEKPGENNVIVGNLIVNNDTGVRLTKAKGTNVGESTKLKPGDIATNTIRNNIRNGVVIESGEPNGIASVDNTVIGNVIEANTRNGVLVQDAASLRNKISRNRITANNRAGIDLQDNANLNLATPVIASTAISGLITGTAPANATVEVYRDPDGQGAAYLGSTTANAGGNWQFNVPASTGFGTPTALAIDAAGNTSRFGSAFSDGIPFLIEISTTTTTKALYISGEGSSPTLPRLFAKLQALTTTQYLVNEGNSVWLSNASLIVGRGVTLTLSPETGVTYLKLRSNQSNAQLAAESAHGTGGAAAIDYASFNYLRTNNGALVIDRVKITSWDTVRNVVDTDHDNGRAYVLAKYDARMDIIESDLSYLGSADGESYGVAWRDSTLVTETLGNGSVITTYTTISVTGSAISSTFSHNYYGVYTFRAMDMTWRGNKFFRNVGYGADPHDFSNAMVIDNNEAFENGNHGFIISRGCYNVVFTNNKAYSNTYTIDAQDRNAQGFMIDAGSADSQFPQAASHSNILDGNQAWNNDGYGLRIVLSHANLVQNNIFWNNAAGISVEDGSLTNTMRLNNVFGNRGPGIVLTTGTLRNVIENNMLRGNMEHGVYIKGSSSNMVRSNTIFGNAQAGIKTNILAGYDSRLNQWQQNVVYDNGSGGVSVVTDTNDSIQAPIVVSATIKTVMGTAPAGALVEVFSDYQNEGRFFEGRVLVGPTGQWSLAVSGQWHGPRMTAIAIDAAGNASEFSKSYKNGIALRTLMPLMRK